VRQVFRRLARERDAIVTHIEEIVATRRGRIGQIVINRPRALNALDVRMFEALGETLTAWRDDLSVEAVVVRGAGANFSAGGDIRMVRDAALAGDVATLARMYAAEYSLDALVDAYPKPYVAAIDGYCMGGGLGVAMYGAFRVVTERAVLAMPEVGIGFFPDVGASYVLPRLPDRIGWYMGLTGARLSAAEALACGLATHRLDDANFAHVEEIVAEDPARAAIASRLDAVAVKGAPSAFDKVTVASAASASEDIVVAPAGLDAIAVAPAPPSGGSVRAAIARCFDQSSLVGIVQALERESSDWSTRALSAMRAASPTALAITFELFRRGSTQTLEECLETEYQLALQVARSGDFLEGVRAMVIDKDRKPRWNPARIEDLRPEPFDALWRSVDVTRDELRLTPMSP
jgi:enoyl-CoA hydratase